MPSRNPPPSSEYEAGVLIKIFGFILVMAPLVIASVIFCI
jgi:hypothetical protein